MKVLLVGNGGREHALLWRLRKDDPAIEFHVTRPNGGMQGVRGLDLAPTDVSAIVASAREIRPDLTVVGPEAPLAAGLVDALQDEGFNAFGPSAAAARIESSKAFAKDLMARAGIPTAAHRTFSDPDEARGWIREQGAPIVVKASGLAAGKGAVVCMSIDDALDAVGSMMDDAAFGQAGAEVVVEEYMEGEELSFFCLVAGEEVFPLLPSQDHKRVGEGDTGPNTGGMGAYAPVSIATPALVTELLDTIVSPTALALAESGAPFFGLLYAGVMLTPSGPRVVEFNCRFGDPETQVVLPLLDGSLIDAFLTVAEGRALSGLQLRARGGAAVTTVAASGGYPGPYDKGTPITIPAAVEEDPAVIVFHAGTARVEDRLVTAGGRVLAATGLGPDVSAAARKSRDAIASIAFEGRQYRADIGWREIARGG